MRDTCTAYAEICDLFDMGWDSRSISTIMDCTQEFVQFVLRELYLIFKK